MFQGPSAEFSTVGYKREEKEEEKEGVSEVHGDDRSQHSRYLLKYFKSSNNISLFIVYLVMESNRCRC